MAEEHRLPLPDDDDPHDANDESSLLSPDDDIFNEETDEPTPPPIAAATPRVPTARPENLRELIARVPNDIKSIRSGVRKAFQPLGALPEMEQIMEANEVSYDLLEDINDQNSIGLTNAVTDGKRLKEILGILDKNLPETATADLRDRLQAVLASQQNQETRPIAAPEATTQVAPRNNTPPPHQHAAHVHKEKPIAWYKGVRWYNMFRTGKRFKKPSTWTWNRFFREEGREVSEEDNPLVNGARWLIDRVNFRSDKYLLRRKK